MRKVVCVVGTRPEAVKLAPVMLELRKRPADFAAVLVSTGQHRGILDQALDAFDLKPDHDLGIMRPDQTLFHTTTLALDALGKVIEAERPDALVVQGDTTSAFAGALAAFYHKVPVAHVEAGLRTTDKREPFPEEMNRRLVDRLSDWLFAPTEDARANLLREGLPADRAWVTGNTGIDALVEILRRANQPGLAERLRALEDALGIEGQRVVLVTGHRRENHGEPLAEVCRALRALAAREDAVVVYPAHPNPNVQRAVASHLSGTAVRVIPPLDYPSFAWLLSRATLAITDSGGVQEEAGFLGIPTLVFRKETERGEAIAAGVARLVAPREADVAREASRILDDAAERAAMARPTLAFGDGRASGRILDVLRDA